MFLNPLGLLALLSLPAIVALHLFRRRFRPRVVSALFLWGESTDAATAGRRRERLLRSPSLWSELGAALCLALALAGPRSCGDARARHLVLLLDGSASMSARNAEGSPRDRAVLEAIRELRALPSGSRATLVVSGARPRVLAGPGAFPEEARERLDAYRPAGVHHDFGASLALALELAGDGPCTFLTDRFEPDSLPPEVEARALGSALENLAIARASRSALEGEGELGERVLLSVASYCAAPQRARVTLSAEGARIAERELELAPAERRELELDLPAGAGAIEARIDALDPGVDALEIDDGALLLPEPRRVLALASELDEATARAIGLMSASSTASRIDRWLALVPGSVEVDDARGAQLAIGRAPASSGGTWSLSLESAPGERIELVSPFLVERGNALLAGVTLDGVIWSVSDALALEGRPLVSAGNRTLLAEHWIGGRLALRANIDVARSTLWSSPDWPILLANLAEARRRELPGPVSVNLACGEALLHRIETPGEHRLRGPGTDRNLYTRELVAVDDLDAPGLYVLERDGRELARFALAFADAAESDLRELSSGHRPASTRAGALRAEGSWMAQVLLSLGLACMLLDAWVLRARRARA